MERPFPSHPKRRGPMKEHEDRKDGDEDVAEDLEVGDEADDVVGGLRRNSDPEEGGQLA
jgi:hypothetical protein